MVAPDWIWYIFVFALGCCIGSFLNVVIYRVPREKSLVYPGSACPACAQPIRFYDNIPLLSWLILRGKCRNCKAPVSGRYFVVEFLTGVIYLGLFVVFFQTPLRPDVPEFLAQGWLVYLVYIVLLSVLVAASAIDLELWIIPLGLCWFVTGAAIAGTVAGNVMGQCQALPSSSPRTAALALGALVGLMLSLGLLACGLVKRSYAFETENQGQEVDEDQINHRREALQEILFIAPIVVFSIGFAWVTAKLDPVQGWWASVHQYAAVKGALGCVWGYFIGCAIVWATRILGTLALGKEAMGLGDVHLMGAIGAVIGPVMVTLAFFIAPFFGLAWALFQMFFKKTRQIPYGPFLSIGTFVVIIFQYWFLGRMGFAFGY